MAQGKRPRVHGGNDALAGVFADDFEVWLSDHGFTIDFLRSDPAAPAPGKDVLVARVAFSPKLAAELIDELGERFAQYNRRAMPPEIYGDEGSEPDE